ncbi:MAG TPA: hypothetical protein VNR41_12710 [Xanthobacteraceae bacterium]|jgi:hypothetical protein|nr:hypothetical protein [Xanthobacteraceae bacterium]
MSKTKAERFRIMAAECERQAELATEEAEFREMQMRLANSFHALAENEDWLDGRAEAGSAETALLAASVYEAA